jgi:FOG: GGDEF domain
MNIADLLLNQFTHFRFVIDGSNHYALGTFAYPDIAVTFVYPVIAAVIALLKLPMPLTVSIGYACSSPDRRTFDALMKKADAMMYISKNRKKPLCKRP